MFYTTLPQATIFNISFGNLHLSVPTSIPNPETQVFLNESIKNSCTVSFDSWSTDKKVVRTSDYQFGIGSSVKFNSHNYLIAAHQTAARSGVANQATKLMYQFSIVLMLKNILLKTTE